MCQLSLKAVLAGHGSTCTGMAHVEKHLTPSTVARLLTQGVTATRVTVTVTVTVKLLNSRTQGGCVPLGV